MADAAVLRRHEFATAVERAETYAARAAVRAETRERWGPAVSAAPGVIATAPASCPSCGTAPAYKTTPADPWDFHEVCPGCGFCYTHNKPRGDRVTFVIVDEGA